MRRLCAAAALFFVLTACLYLCIASFAFNPNVYSQEPPFDRMAQETAAYLRGKQAALSPELFGEQERQHMADVLGLFRFGRRTAFFLGALGALCICAGWREKRYFWIGAAVFTGLTGALAVWAALDFTGWFTAMHRMAFSNDLWLFDASSPLIQMMPESFFVSAAELIGGRLLTCVCGAFLFGFLCKGKKA